MDYIQNYISLQELRIRDQQAVRFQVKGKIDKQQIAPLLFIPIIENAFKHGLKGDTKNVFVHVFFEISVNAISLYVENNKGHFEDLTGKIPGGLGLENLKQRLELIYPEKHSLKIEESEQKFITRLKINLT